jgi:hypothetical protein
MFCYREKSRDVGDDVGDRKRFGRHAFELRPTETNNAVINVDDDSQYNVCVFPICPTCAARPTILRAKQSTQYAKCDAPVSTARENIRFIKS